MRFGAVTGLVLAAMFCVLPVTQPAAKPNLLVITIDTLRADHLGCYGYKKHTSPAIDALAKESVLFEHAYSSVPLTLPSHATMFSGQYPEKHGLRDNGHFVWKGGPLVAELLRQNGYKTAAFVSGTPLAFGFGLNRGFQIYDDDFTGGERRADQTTNRALQWLKGATGPYLLWIHYYDPHAEYEPPKDVQKFADPYDGEIAFVDREIGKLLKSVSNQTVVILTADHGESLGEHGETTHAVFVYNSTLHVPLMIRAPGWSVARRSEAVTLADIAPTLLEFAGLRPVNMDGRSLFKPVPDRTLFAESLYAQRNYGYAPLFAAIRQNRKMILAPDPEFYDLTADPNEKNNIVKSSRVQDWERAVKQYSKDSSAVEESTLPPEEQEKLRSLGYVSGNVARTGADPKSKIQIMERFRLGMVMLKKEQFPEAETRFREIVKTENHNGLAFRFLGDALSAQQKYGEAVKAFKTSMERLPDPEVAVQLAKAANRAGNAAQAEAVLQDTIRRFPAYEQASFELASLYTGKKDFARALGLLSGNSAEMSNQRGLVHMNQGDPSKAVSEFLAAIKKQEKATYWNNLGIAHQQMKQISPSENAYKRALEIKPDYSEAEANLAFLLISLSRWDEASASLEKITSRNSSLWRARMALGYVREMQGRSGEAVQIYKRLLTEAPVSWPERGVADARLRKLLTTKPQ